MYVCKPLPCRFQNLSHFRVGVLAIVAMTRRANKIGLSVAHAQSVQETADVKRCLVQLAIGVGDFMQGFVPANEAERLGKANLMNAVRYTSDWLDQNPNALKEEFEAQLQTLVEVVASIMNNAYIGDFAAAMQFQ